MPTSAYIFRSAENISGIYNTFFGGLFVWKGVAITLQVASMVLLLASLSFAALASRKGTEIWRKLSVVTPCLTLFLLGFVFFQPWDELFVNLRHSLNFAEAGKFSFNLNNPLEATVDFLPYFLIGVLGRLGLPILELALLQSILGAILCLFAGRALLVAWKVRDMEIWALPLLALFPPLWFNAGTGFSTTIFAASVLWTIYFLFYSKNRLFGWILLGLIPLIRVEGAWIVLLLAGLSLKKEKSPLVFAALVPIALLSLWRWNTFGSPIPLPIQYKSTLGDWFFMGVGLRNFVTDMLGTYSLLALFAAGMAALYASKFPPSIKGAFPILGLLFLFVAPYYVSGGDWFPNAWGRYLFPLVLFAVFLGIAAVSHAFYNTEGNARFALIGVLTLAIVINEKFPHGPSQRVENYLFTGRRILGDLNFTKKRRMNFRIQHLSQLGNHLGRTTDAKEILATSEIATISYFARKETIDLLGIANPEIIAQPLRARPDFSQSPKQEMELPHLIFKRVHLDLIPKYMPDYIYMFDMVLANLLDEIPYEEMDNKKVLQAYRRWQFAYKKLIDNLYGGLDKIVALGYEPFIVMYENNFASLYFVAPHAVKSHVKKLGESGFTGGWEKTIF